MAKFYEVVDGRKLIGDVQTADIEGLAVTTAKLADGAVALNKIDSVLTLYTGVYGISEYGRSVYA